MSMTLEQAKEKLAKYGQEHVLKYYGELNEEEKQGILDQIETIFHRKTGCRTACS